MTTATGTSAGRARRIETQTASAAVSASQSAPAKVSAATHTVAAVPQTVDATEAGAASPSGSSAHVAKDAYRIISEGEASDYRLLYNKPAVNGVILNGNLTLEDLGIQAAGDYIERAEIADFIDDVRQYSCSISASNGTVFRNGEGSTTLSAVVIADGEDISNNMVFIWMLDGERIATGKTTLVLASGAPSRVYRYEAYDLLGQLRGSSEVTITNIEDASLFWTSTTAPVTPSYTFTISNLTGDANASIKVGDIVFYGVYRYTVTSVSDTTVRCSNRQSIRGATGATGADAALLRIDSSHGNMFKNNAVTTQLRVTVFYGSQMITTLSALTAAFGASAHLEWYWQRVNENDFHVISASDSRLENDGFAFNLTPDDVDIKVTFICKLITD